MQQQVIQQLKSRNEVNQQAKLIEKRIRYLQRELVRASFKGEDKIDLCRNLLNSIKEQRQKIQALNHNIQA